MLRTSREIDKMASSLGMCLLLTATMSIVVGAANLYKVGDKEGWRLPDRNNVDLYGRWARKNKFQVGDSILFEYRNDSVVRVDKRGYYHCNESSHEPEFTDGRTVFLLDKPGFFYFVSGDLDHCKKGQRLMIKVIDPQSPPIMAGPSPSPVPSAAASSRIPSPGDVFVLGIIVAMAWCPPCVPSSWQLS